MDGLRAFASLVWHMRLMLPRWAADNVVKQSGCEFALAEWQVHAIHNRRKDPIF